MNDNWCYGCSPDNCSGCNGVLKASPTTVEVVNNNPHTMVNALRKLADMIECGDCKVERGGIILNHFTDPNNICRYLEVKSDLVVEY